METELNGGDTCLKCDAEIGPGVASCPVCGTAQVVVAGLNDSRRQAAATPIAAPAAIPAAAPPAAAPASPPRSVVTPAPPPPAANPASPPPPPTRRIPLNQDATQVLPTAAATTASMPELRPSGAGPAPPAQQAPPAQPLPRVEQPASQSSDDKLFDGGDYIILGLMALGAAMFLAGLIWMIAAAGIPPEWVTTETYNTFTGEVVDSTTEPGIAESLGFFGLMAVGGFLFKLGW